MDFPSASQKKGEKKGMIKLAIARKTVILPTINDVKEFVTAINQCPYKATLKSGEYVVDAKSIMGVFSLDLTKPVALEIEGEKMEADCLKGLLDGIGKFIVKD